MPITLKKTQQKLILISLGATVIPLMIPSSALADGTTLKIFPSVIQIEAKPPADIWAPFVIENQSNQAINLSIGYRPFDPQASHNGIVSYLQDGQQISGQDKQIFQKMQIVNTDNISQSSIDLGPKQKERLRLHLIIPEKEPTSDYYFSLVFLENLNKIDQIDSHTSIEAQRSSSLLQAGIATNVLLAIGDKETPQASIDTFSTAAFHDGGPIPFTLSVHNEGLHFISPHGTIMIKNMFGQTVGKVVIPPSVILAGTSRTLSGRDHLPYTRTSINSSDSFSPQLVWPESFLFGAYTATLSIALSDMGPVYSRSITFFALPLSFLLEVFIVLVILTLIYLRVKKKIS